MNDKSIYLSAIRMLAYCSLEQFWLKTFTIGKVKEGADLNKTKCSLKTIPLFKFIKE